MSAKLHRLLAGEEAVSKGIIDIEAVLNNIDKESLDTKGENGDFPLHQAARLPNATSALIIIREMISKGADVNSRNDSDRTPLHIAIKAAEHYESTEVIKLLLENGADIFIEDESGIKPVDMASPEISELLNTYAKDKINTAGYFDVKEYILKSINVSIDQASMLMHKLEGSGFVLGYVGSEPA